MRKPLVSVVVPTRNNARTIEACVQAAARQTYRPLEVIVVDNHSVDGTADLARRHTERVVIAGPERSAQRNTGVALAAGDWIVWLDSDLILPPDAVAVAMRLVGDTGAAGVAMPERTIGSGFWTAVRALERACFLDDPALHNPRLLPRDVMMSEGRFDLAMSGPEDVDLRLRLQAAGKQIALAPFVVDHDEGRLTLTGVLRHGYAYGRSLPAFAAKNQGAVSAHAKAVLRAYLRHRPELLRDPAHAAGLVVLRGVEAVGYAVGALRGRRARAGVSVI